MSAVPAHVTIIRIGNFIVRIGRVAGKPSVGTEIAPFPEMRSRTS